MKRIRTLSLLGVALALVLTTAAVYGASEHFQAGAPREPVGGPTRMVGGHMAPVVPPDKLAAASDLVVRVTLRSVGEETWPFPGSRAMPDLPAKRRVDVIELDVLQSLRGPAPDSLTVFLPRAGGTVIISGDNFLELMTFEEGKEYILFLITTDDSQYWPGGGYLIQGAWQGHWEIEGDVAARALPPMTLSLDELRRDAKQD